MSYDEDRGIYRWGDAWPKFVDHVEDVWDLIEDGKWAHEFIVIDSLTTLANQCMNHVLKLDGKSVKGAQPAVQNWGQQLRFLETTMEQLASWPVGLIVTAHIKRDDNIVLAEGKEYLPLVAGQLSGKIGIYFDEVWYTRVDGDEVTIRTQAGGMYKQAKSRHNIPDGTLLDWKHIGPYLGVGV